MKNILIGLVSCVTILTSSLVYADALDGVDDRYIGFQMTIPLETNHGSFFAGKAEYSVMMIEQTDGIKKGIAFTQHINGNQTMDYILPSQTFRIGQSRVSNFTIPILNLNEDGRVRINQTESTGGEAVAKTAAGALVVVVGLAAGALIIEELAKVAVVAVAECITGATCTPGCCLTIN